MDNHSGGSLEQIQTGGAKVSFFNHMFHLKKAEKCELYNVVQYSILALLPLIVIIRINQNLWPKADQKKGTIELLAEMIGEIAVTSLAVFVVFRVIEYIPTFSGEPLKCINLLTIITTLIVGLPWYDKDSNIGNKAKELHKRINSNLPTFLSSTLDDQSDPKSKKEKLKNGKKIPTHQASRADQPILPPPRVGSLRDPNPMSNYQMNSPDMGGLSAGGNGGGGSIPDDVVESYHNGGQFAPSPPPLMAANEALSGFGGAAW